MALTPDEVRRLADLARLELTDDDARTLAGQLAGILERIEALEAGDDDGAGPAVSDTTHLRADAPGTDPMALPPSAVAPGWAEGFFTVPRLASHRGDGEGA